MRSISILIAIFLICNFASSQISFLIEDKEYYRDSSIVFTNKYDPNIIIKDFSVSFTPSHEDIKSSEDLIKLKASNIAAVMQMQILKG